MGQNSNIEWTHHTFNPWRGCTKVSPGCMNCYAEKQAARNPRALGVWGKDGERVIASESYWYQALVWNKLAHAAGERHRVFCASMADVFESADTMPSASVATVRAARVRLFDLIRQTPYLDWLLLTKRPENVMDCVRQAALDCRPGDLCEMLNCWLLGGRRANAPDNVWLGTSIENQATADERIPHLLRVPAAVRFLSCEPLLGAVDLRLRPAWSDGNLVSPANIGRGAGELGWVIVGGESGPKARPCDIAWIRSIVGQCKAAKVPVFVKQLGAKFMSAFEEWNDGNRMNARVENDGTWWMFNDRKGGDMTEWPADLRVREFPEVKHALD